MWGARGDRLFRLPAGPALLIMVGAPDMAFPRLNNISFWLLSPSLLLLLSPALVEVGTSTRWMVYPSLSGITSHSGGAVDSAISSLHLYGVPSILGSINFITKISNMRGPGMIMHRSSFFVWFVPRTCSFQQHSHFYYHFQY